MIGFMNPFGAGPINIDAIQRIAHAYGSKDKSAYLTVAGEDGQRRVDYDDVDELMKRVVHVIPAAPGLQLLYVGYDDTGVFLSRTMLIAWAICLDGVLRPISPAGVDDAGSEPTFGWYVESAEGRIFGMGIDAETFSDVAALRAHISALHERRQS